MQQFRASLGTSVCGAVLLWLSTSGVASEAPASARSIPDAPNCKPIQPGSQRSYYPEKAKQLGLQGRLLIDFSIDRNGHPTAVVAVDPDPRIALLTRAAISYMGSLHCAGSADPSSTQPKLRRYQLGFIFDFGLCLPTGPCTPPVPYPSVEMIRITAYKHVTR